MFGYVISTQFGESKIWDYASVIVFEEIGFDLKMYRGKVFHEEVLEMIQGMVIGDQVEFEIKRTERGERLYTEFTMIRPKTFSVCNKCKKAEHEEKCTGEENSERLEGEYQIINVDKKDRYSKIVLKDNKTQFTFIHWSNSPFKESFECGDRVKVCGWRNENRITKLRLLQKL